MRYGPSLLDLATGEWYLINENGSANPFFFGNPGDIPFVGDWDCDGIETPGLYRQWNERYSWLAETIDDAAAEGIPWVIVGMHKVCITAGNKPCEVGEDLANLLIDKRVDLVLSGHDHDYQRSHQLDCVVIDCFESSCIANSGADGLYPADGGTVFVITRLTGGGGTTEIDPNDAEYPYFASTLGAGDNGGRGFFHVTLASNTLTGTFVGTTTSFSDTFTIR